MIRAAFVSVALLAACAPPAGETPAEKSAPPPGSSAVPAPTPQDVTLRVTAEQNGQTITIGVNQRFAVELVGVPTAGYVWEPKTVPAFLTRAGEASGNTVAAQSQPGYVGGNHWEVLIFAAIEAGSGELVIEQRRPWENGQPANDTFRVNVVAQ